jgi:hypothetical protein
MRRTRGDIRWLSRAAAAVTAAGAWYVSRNWLRYGHPRRPKVPDPVLDRFMPEYEARERHARRVSAPAAVTFEAGLEQDLLASAVVRALFRAREMAMGGKHPVTEPPRGLLPSALALGWVVLAHEPNARMVFGAVTRPWEANPRFEGVAPERFAEFDEPGYVKILWTIGAEALTDATSLIITETRVRATDAESRKRFRRYWTVVVPGIRTIRRQLLGRVKHEAERRASVKS